MRPLSLVRYTSRIGISLFVFFSLLMTGCGSGGGADAPNPGASSFAIGGSVTGLAAGQSVVLQNNSGDNLTVSTNRSFTFATLTSAYAVAVFTQPTGQTCTVTNGTGTAIATVSNVAVACVNNPSFTIGGSITGLAAGQSVVLSNNGGDNLTRSADGTFNFVTPTSAYAVTVFTQPTGQTCTVTNGTGTAIATVSNVAVNCVTNPAGTFTISVNVTGLAAGQSVVLQNNSGDILAVIADGSFSFAKPSSGYAVTVYTQPTGQTCNITNGTGTATATVSNVVVSCVTNTFTIGGSITGLAAGQSVVLSNNGGDNLTRSADGTFNFVTPTSAYAVTVFTQPTGQTCTVTNGTGTAIATVSNVTVICANNPPPAPTSCTWDISTWDNCNWGS